MEVVNRFVSNLVLYFLFLAPRLPSRESGGRTAM